MRSKLFSRLCIGFLGSLATGLVSAEAVTEYTSLASWDSAVSDVTIYAILAPPIVSDGVMLPTPPINPFNGETGEMIGAATFTAPGNLGLVFNDGLFGNVQYVAASPGAFGGFAPATVVASFDPSTDVTALAFTLGSKNVGSDINISVNGSALAPLVVSTAFPTAFLGVTDTSGPITNIAFTVSNFEFSGSQGTVAEMDVIGSYATAVVKAPEIEPASATSALTLLFGGLAVLRGRKRGC